MRKKSESLFLKEKINKLVKQGFSFQEIADIFKLKSRQLARYHFVEYQKRMK